MRAIAFVCALAALPAFADDAPRSQAGTAFMKLCLKDVSEQRIASLKQRAPDYAATLSDDDLQAGGMAKAQKACPCFLHIIAVDPQLPGATPEEKAASIVAYLDAQSSETPLPMPPVISRLTRMCGERSAILPPKWVAN